MRMAVATALMFTKSNFLSGSIKFLFNSYELSMPFGGTRSDTIALSVPLQEKSRGEIRVLLVSI